MYRAVSRHVLYFPNYISSLVMTNRAREVDVFVSPRLSNSNTHSRTTATKHPPTAQYHQSGLILPLQDPSDLNTQPPLRPSPPPNNFLPHVGPPSPRLKYQRNPSPTPHPITGLKHAFNSGLASFQRKERAGRFGNAGSAPGSPLVSLTSAWKVKGRELDEIGVENISVLIRFLTSAVGAECGCVRRIIEMTSVIDDEQTRRRKDER